VELTVVVRHFNVLPLNKKAENAVFKIQHYVDSQTITTN
jgi:ribosomal protein L31E